MRGIEGEQVVLRIVLSESRTVDGIPLHTKILEVLRSEGMAGATVLKGAAGFGHDGRLHTDTIEVLTAGLPIVIEVVDTPDHIERVTPLLADLTGDGVMMTRRVRVIRYASR